MSSVKRPASEVYGELGRSAYAPLTTPDHIKAKAVDVLHQVNGLSYSDALYALEVAQRTMRDAIERLHQEQVFSPPIFQPRSPKDSGDRP